MEQNIDITTLLNQAGSGNAQTVEKILPRVYSELRLLARGMLSSERSNHTLQSTALVHEAYLRLVNQHQANWHNRAHFFGVAAMVIRRILVDHARRRSSQRRGGGEAHLSLDDVPTIGANSPDHDLLDLDEALRDLADHDERSARVVEMRFFGGLTHEEIAEVLQINERTVRRDWTHARAWLYNRIVNNSDQGNGRADG